MHCSQCGVAIAADAKFCGKCGSAVAGGGGAAQHWSQSKNWGWVVALLILALAWVTGKCSTDPPAEKKEIAAVDPAACDKALAGLEATGLVRDRPAANRIDVDERIWAEMPAKQKRLAGAAIRCSALRGRIGREDMDSYAVVYGYRSGKRLAMATHVGVSLE